MLLKDKVVIVTGVGPGMGSKLAKIAAAEGARVAVSARTASYVETVVGEIREAGGTAIGVPTDVADATQCQNLAEATLDAFGRIDGLVNSARAHGPFMTFEDGDIAEWIANMDVTCFGALRMAKAVLPAMKRQKEGAIVNVSTMAAIKPMLGEADYATAKGALTTATRQLADELGRYNIRVNCTRMGWMWGKPVQGYVRHQAKTTGVSEAEIIEGIASRIALRVIPPDEECAKSVLFFVSDYSRMVSGASLDVNGGEYMAP
jgi:NAD(P)-dependent dehydrogenase (short-subunit alcohol dehydrogenase family)